MHILLLPSFYKNSQNSVAGSFFEEQARMLLNKGYTVSVICFNYYAFTSKPHTNEYYLNDNGIQTFYYNYQVKFPRLRKLNYYLFGRFATEKIKLYINQFGKPSVIHAHNAYYGGIASFYASKNLNIPYVITEHSTNFLLNEIENKIDLYFAKKVYAASKVVICVSTTFKQDLLNFFSLTDEKVKVVPNVVSPIFFEDRVSSKADKRGLIFYCNAFYCERKNTLELIKAFANYKKNYPEGKLILSGGVFRAEEMQYQNLVNETISNLVLNNSVKQLGIISRQGVKEQIQLSDASILTSVYETFGVSLIESLAQGKPIITTNSKGPLDIVNANNGILVNGFDSDSIADAMTELTKNYDSYKPDEITNDCKRKFSEDSVSSQLKNIYNSI